MPFIGNQPALSYTSFAKQDFTTSATTSYTLDNPVTNENELALFINFVRQEPTTAYTASGTSLTLTSATSASDDMYCVFLGKAVQTVNPPSGSVGISQLSATGTKDSTTFLRGDNTFASAGGTNTPAFFATMSANQTGIADNTFTKVQFNSERFDTDSAYDPTTNYRFTVPTGKGGKYFLSTTLLFTSSSFLYFTDLVFYINGTAADKFVTTGNDIVNNVQNIGITLNSILSLNATDYVEVFVKIDTSSAGTFDANQNTTASPRCFWYGYKIIE